MNAPARELLDRATYQHPERECDIVMKGGVTSGIVYPLAICELARKYRFRSIGGTSAGAIAAALAAAAELGRASQSGGFCRLAELPEWLGKDEHLLRLFQPQPGTENLFALAEAAARRDDSSVASVLTTAITRYSLFAWAAAALPLLVAAIGFAHGGAGGVATGIAGLLMALAAGPLGALVGIAFDFFREVAPNGYGLCSGLAGHAGESPALSPFLDEYIQAAAGREPGEPPVTFGDLWGRLPEPALDLVLMTTSLTHGRPFHLPFTNNLFYFDRVELARYVPERLVEWMARHPRGYHKRDDEVETQGRLLRFPAAVDLPLAVAARMSCSFPVLLSAIPLYAVDFTRTKAPGAKWPLTRCWFSDGGISSNFPIHFFDSALPSRPTFGINLKPFNPDYPKQADQCANVWMPSTNNEGLKERMTALPDGAGSLGGFIGLILDAMQNWRDNGMMRLPGYRDRIVHVSIDESTEGGLNLDMPEPLVADLAERGRCAGVLIRDRYAKPPAPGVDVSWDNQRWVRYRFFLASLQKLIHSALNVYERNTPPDKRYVELVMRGLEDLPRSYRLDARQLAEALATMKGLEAMTTRWQASGVDFDHRAPSPRGDLRVAPPE